MRPRFRSLGLLALLLASSTHVAAQIPQSSFTVELQEVATGLAAPIALTHAGDGSGRLFIVEQKGQILVIENGILLPTPFLDIAASLPTLGTFYDERGLLGLAFHPNYETNGRFFVRYSIPRIGDPGEPCTDPTNFIPGCHSEVLAEFRVSAGDPNVADPTSEVVLFTIEKPEFNHNSGHLAFGPDGYLYVTMGDGGGGGDGLGEVPPAHGPIGNGQNIETLMGKMLRLDVDSPPAPGLAYAIPPSNPFVGGPGRDEIYAYGLRNPYRFSFDDGPGGDGSLFLTDVGQNLFEELNIGQLGANYGWAVREGLHCFDPFGPDPLPSCPTTGLMGEPLVDPVMEYRHDVGGITIIGGYVYRGLLNPSFRGRYVFGDFATDFFTPSGHLYHVVDHSGGVFEMRELMIGVSNRPYGMFLKGFGEDEDNEVYVCGSSTLGPFGTGGVVHRLIVLAPVPAVVSSLQGEASPRGIQLSWEVANAGEIDAVRVLRSSAAEPARVVAEWTDASALSRGWTDAEAQVGVPYTYQVSVVVAGNAIFSNQIELTRTTSLPQRTQLLGNMPNPFNPATQIRFELARGGDVVLQIFDASGRLVRRMDLAGLPSGLHSVLWNGRDGADRGVASGVYRVRLDAAGVVDTRSMTMVR